MRNQIGIPPLDREIDTGAPIAPGSIRPKVAHHRSHVGLDPDIAESARRGDVPHAGAFEHLTTERDANAGLYVGLAIGAVVLILIALILIAFL